MKNLLTQWETEEENRKIVDNVDRKVVDEKHSRSVLVKKPSNPVGKLRRKTDALCVRLQLREVGLKGEVGARRIEISMDRNFDKWVG